MNPVKQALSIAALVENLSSDLYNKEEVLDIIDQLRTEVQSFGVKTSHGKKKKRQSPLCPDVVLRVLRNYPEGVGTKDLSAAIGYCEGSVVKQLKRLEMRGKVSSEVRAKWCTKVYMIAD